MWLHNCSSSIFKCKSLNTFRDLKVTLFFLPPPPQLKLVSRHMGPLLPFVVRLWMKMPYFPHLSFTQLLGHTPAKEWSLKN